MSFKRRLLAGILAVVVFCALTFSVSFIVLEANHDCDGDDCRICAVIATCVNTFKALALYVGVFSASMAFAFALCFKIGGDGLLRCASTLTSLKIKLLN